MSTNRKWRTHVALGMGFALSTIFLWLALRQVDGKSLRGAMATVSYIPLLLSAAGLALGIVLRAFRWRVIAGFPVADQHSFSHATNLGVLVNLLFPGRAGELVRVITLSRLTGSSLAGPMASALIDRLVDVFVLFVSACVLYAMFPIGALVGKWIAVLLIAGCVIVLCVVLYARSAGVAEALIARVARSWLKRLPLAPETFLSELRAELRRLLGSWLSLKLIGLAVLVFCADYGAVAMLLKAFNLSLALEAPLLLWVFLAAGSALPSAPGYVGIYQVAAVWALGLFSVSAPIAVALATVLQIATLGVAIVMAGPGALGIIKRMLFTDKKASLESL